MGVDEGVSEYGCWTRSGSGRLGVDEGVSEYGCRTRSGSGSGQGCQ